MTSFMPKWHDSFGNKLLLAAKEVSVQDRQGTRHLEACTADEVIVFYFGAVFAVVGSVGLLVLVPAGHARKE